MKDNAPSLLSSILRGYLWVTVLLALGALIVILTTFRSAFRERAVDDFTRSAWALVPLVQTQLQNPGSPSLDSLVNAIAPEMEARITVIARDGSVYADSENNPEEMENHRTRVEVIAAFNGIPAHSIRLSETLGREMLYTAVPVFSGDSVIAVVRTSQFSNSYSALMNPVLKRMFCIILSVIAIAILSGWIISRRISLPMSNLADVADRVRRGDLGARAAPGHTREHNSLAASLNGTLSKNEELISDLSQSDSRNSAILFSMTEGVAVISESGSILLINDSFRTLFDIRSSEKEIPGEVAALFSRNDTAGQLRFEDRMIAYSMAPVEGSGDSVFSFRDITREVQLSEMKKNFAINVSHELRTPLTAIKGYAETLQEEISGEGSRYLDVILRNTDRLISLVTDIQTLSEVESNNEVIKLESIPVDEIMTTVMPLFSSMAEEKGIALSFIQEKPRISISVDRYRIEQVFVNLIDNAVKYTDSGTVEVRASTRGELAVFTVSDTGRGIPGEALGRIFERFFVVDRSRSRRLGGTGLGLSIVKHIIEVHGGTISVSSTPGRGSIFLFTLPLAE